MARSLSLTAYRALSRRNKQKGSQSLPPRAPGELVWLHATDNVRLSALLDLSRRLRQARPNIFCLLTFDENVALLPIEELDDESELLMELNSDHPNEARQFLDHWAPDLCLWTGDRLQINIVNAAADRKIPLILTDVTGTEFQSGRHTWIPDLKRASYDFFDKILANNKQVALDLKRIGLRPEKISVTERLQPGTFPPGCNEEDLSDVMQDLGGRPVWLAAGVQSIELDAILAAHRSALRYSHRLLLIIAMADPDASSKFRSRLEDEGWRVADWDDGDEIEDNTQVVISATPSDLGLWYRASPITFLASSFVPGGGGIDPRNAAALGSAILFGPDVSDHQELYENLQQTGAARMVTGSDGLGEQLPKLMAPDCAAEMALAGWELVTEGAELTSILVDLIEDMLDRRETADART